MYFWTFGPLSFSVSVTTVSFNTVYSVYIHSDSGKKSTYRILCLVVQELLVQRQMFFFLNYR